MTIERADTARTIGEAIRRARKNAGLTQTQLGELVGISDRTVREIEKGTGAPSLASVAASANALGLRLGTH